MDANKKFLYFNTTATDTDADGGVQDAALTIPSSSIVAFDVRATGSIVVMTKEAVQTDTTDITLIRTSTDPRGIIEEIVNEINFSKDAMIVVGDDNTSEYIHDDIDNIDGISAATYSSPLIKLGSDIHVFQQQATEPGAGFSASSYTFNTGSVGTINGEVITTLFLDLGANSATTDGNQNKVIGKSGATANASVTKITEAKNGVVYGAELICVETPAGTDIPTDIDVRVTTDSLTTGDNIAAAASLDNLLLASASMAKGDRIRTDNNQDGFGGMDNHFVYLTEGTNHASPGTAGSYSAGKFILRLFGAPTVNLNSKT